MAELAGSALGALMCIACFREIAFSNDDSRTSWVKGGIVAIPFIFVIGAIGRAEAGTIEFSASLIQAGMTGLFTLLFFGWAKLKADAPYERTRRKLPKILAWVWVTFLTSMMVFKLFTGLA